MQPVRMVRDAKAFPESHEANVTADMVADFERWGWSKADPLDHDGDGKKGGSKGKKGAADLLDAPQPDADGLTLRELHADLEALGETFDPAASAADLFAQRNTARVAKAA